MQNKKVEYVIWLNRAFDFYAASKYLYTIKDQFGRVAAFCANQSVELLLKAILIYWDKSFNPKEVNHNFTALINALKNKVPNAKDIDIPNYLYYKGLYQSASRYPRGGIGIPGTFLIDLDKCFHDLLILVPPDGYNANFLSKMSKEMLNALLTTV